MTPLAVIARSPCDEAIQGPRAVAPGLLRFARNDGGVDAAIIGRLLIQGSGIYVCCGSRTIVINGRGWGDVASKRLDDDLRPFTSAVELKIVNFAGNCFCHEIAEPKRHAALERTDKIREYALSISNANIGSIPYRSRAAKNLSISLYREIQHDLRSVRLVKWLQAISKMGLHVAHIGRGHFL